MCLCHFCSPSSEFTLVLHPLGHSCGNIHQWILGLRTKFRFVLVRLTDTNETMSRTVSSPIPVSGQAQSYHSTSMSGPRKTRSTYSVAARLTERMCSSAVAEEILSSLKDFAPESLHYRYSMPNIFESPSKDLLTVSPTTTISIYDHSPLRNHLICTSMTGMDTDTEVFSETSEEPIKNSGRRSSTKKQPRSCDDDSNSSSTTSIFSNRKRVHRSSKVGKRLKTTDSSRFLCVEKRREESISSAGELERFFDSMGLDDQTAAQRLRNPRLHVQVSDDAMEESDEEDQEEALESVSVMGAIKLVNSVDTDDDEPDSPRQTVTLGGQKEAVMKKTPSMKQNTRIYEWLVNCRPVNEK
ncbi:hypothetical protein RvY_02404 [Ramazzottius varieornatus]|uniref:Uncharacterized protein n=1 Tax=Ramazzottius varieornatus TaxID=947166 RepID=A0A1D1UMY5_RAMVA|nr:hypothetical protein RvY_02404 [Ramazzottius varieornatus]